MSASPTYEDFKGRIPSENHMKLKQPIDFERSTDLHLGQLAGKLENWENIAPLIQLSGIEIVDIKKDNPSSQEDQKKACLKKWKSKRGFKATYEELLRQCVQTENFLCAKEIVTLLGGTGSGGSRTVSDGGPNETDGPGGNRIVPDGGTEETDDEIPLYDESQEVVAEPQDKPSQGTRKHEELQKFSTEVVFILQTVNDIEFKAALSVLEPPSKNFRGPVFFPVPSMVAGKIEGWKVVLIKAGAGRAVGYHVADALKEYPKARFVIGVGVCYAFKQGAGKNQPKFADVLVSKFIRDYSYMKFEDNEIKDLGQTIIVVRKLQQIFCMQKKKELKFDVSTSRKSVMHSGTFCCNTFLIKDEGVRDRFHRLHQEDIGGEMEGGELLQLQQDIDSKVEGIIIIKGVADFADKDKAKHWQYIAAKAALHYIKAQLRNTEANGNANSSFWKYLYFCAFIIIAIISFIIAIISYELYT